MSRKAEYLRICQALSDLELLEEKLKAQPYRDDGISYIRKAKEYLEERKIAVNPVRM